MGGGDGEQCPSALGTTKATSVGLGIGMQIISQQANICAPIHARFLLTVPVSMHMVSAFSATVPSGVTVLNYFPCMRDNLSLNVPQTMCLSSSSLSGISWLHLGVTCRSWPSVTPNLGLAALLGRHFNPHFGSQCLKLFNAIYWQNWKFSNVFHCHLTALFGSQCRKQWDGLLPNAI